MIKASFLPSRAHSLARLSLAASVTVAALFGAGALQGCAVTSGQSSVGEYVDDATISTRVRARFAEDSQVSAMRLSVETLKGEVQLSGFAASQAEKDRAGQIASKVPGVKNVRNNVVVRSGKDQ